MNRQRDFISIELAQVAMRYLDSIGISYSKTVHPDGSITLVAIDTIDLDNLPGLDWDKTELAAWEVLGYLHRGDPIEMARFGDDDFEVYLGMAGLSGSWYVVYPLERLPVSPEVAKWLIDNELVSEIEPTSAYNRYRLNREGRYFYVTLCFMALAESFGRDEANHLRYWTTVVGFASPYAGFGYLPLRKDPDNWSDLSADKQSEWLWSELRRASINLSIARNHIDQLISLGAEAVRDGGV